MVISCICPILWSIWHNDDASLEFKHNWLPVIKIMWLMNYAKLVFHRFRFFGICSIQFLNSPASQMSLATFLNSRRPATTKPVWHKLDRAVNSFRSVSTEPSRNIKMSAKALNIYSVSQRLYVWNQNTTLAMVSSLLLSFMRHDWSCSYLKWKSWFWIKGEISSLMYICLFYWYIL